jgi:hypothetical protein
MNSVNAAKRSTTMTLESERPQPRGEHDFESQGLILTSWSSYKKVQRSHKMKKQKLALLAIVAAVMTVLATPSSAFQSVQIATRAASVLTGGSLSASFTLKIRNTNDPLNPAVDLATITWSGVTPPTTQWKIADQLMVLVATVTDGNGGVQIYTNNKASDSSYSFVDPTPGITNNPDSDPAGLLKVPVAGTSKKTRKYRSFQESLGPKVICRVRSQSSSN